MVSKLSIIHSSGPYDHLNNLPCQKTTLQFDRKTPAELMTQDRLKEAEEKLNLFKISDVPNIRAPAQSSTRSGVNSNNHLINRKKLVNVVAPSTTSKLLSYNSSPVTTGKTATEGKR